MLALLFVISVSVRVISRPEYYEENGWLKKIGRGISRGVRGIGRGIKRGVRAVTKPIEKGVKSVVRTVDRFIYHASESMYADPIRITKITKNLNQKRYTTTNLESLTQQVARDFNLDPNNVAQFFKRSKFSRTAKTLLNKLRFDKLASIVDRTAQLNTAVIKTTKNGNTFTVNVAGGVSAASIVANNVFKKTTTHWGRSRTSTSRNWRALTASEIQFIFSKVQAEIQNDMNRFKNIEISFKQ
ncbi:hypothetical protein TVAG_345870 [Trichomonas vaginalis G3]|uniref:Uncharacterized protein n=1 Tax=Trichomonas vaginalis (strain ATCC PRA-98 / G3) TaxID=412133 RepID=A2F4X4_TRIV3|nr:uncharacterized protein TVAGG3_1069850 [Trichomonas vaginalis G3]EAY00039.1 hypothetical protein TVAG_345870 [Trichomonas vaginalis G3]KAI5483101.1 hypothetical protein TVAGG3_1069850 [Trichomonas vaginalis G3]|eukprot:XP_001312968.1 hypothetical protein [Trichomonas vaginalis G3]